VYQRTSERRKNSCWNGYLQLAVGLIYFELRRKFLGVAQWLQHYMMCCRRSAPLYRQYSTVRECLRTMAAYQKTEARGLAMDQRSASGPSVSPPSKARTERVQGTCLAAHLPRWALYRMALAPLEHPAVYVQCSTPPREPPLSASLYGLHLAICKSLLGSSDWSQVPSSSPPLLIALPPKRWALGWGIFGDFLSFFPPQRLSNPLHPPKHWSLQHRAPSTISTRDPPERAVSCCFLIQYP